MVLFVERGLARSHDVGARRHANDAHALALEALGETRELVQGYRRVGLAVELANAVGILRAAGVEAAVEGVPEAVPAALQPLFGSLVREGATNLLRHTVAERVNLDRMRANVTEAAEQCGILRIPEVAAPATLAQALERWEPARRLVFCDESAPVQDPIRALEAVEPGPLAVLIGPEGGFAEDERALLLGLPCVVRLALGPRIMRADTAAVAALAAACVMLASDMASHITGAVLDVDGGGEWPAFLAHTPNADELKPLELEVEGAL